MSLLLRRLRHHLRPSFTSPFHRLLSAAATGGPPGDPPFAVVDYLTRSCGLSSEDAIRASKKIQHLKSPNKPDAVLRFLREIGVSESDIRTALTRDPRMLCSSVEKNLRPSLAKLQEICLSIEDISGIISRSPIVCRSNIAPKVDFWMQALGSAETVSSMMKRGASISILGANLEKVVMPNLSFLREQFGLSIHQIVQLIKQAPRLITSNHETLRITAKRAQDLGAACAPGTFLYALIIVSNFNQNTLDARLNNLTSLGFSQEDVNFMIGRVPSLLRISEELICRKMLFLIDEAGCDKLHIVQNPALLLYSLEKRLIPRNFVRKLLKSKEFPVGSCKFVSFLMPSEKNFVEKFVMRYEHAIPGLNQAYADACAGKIAAIEWFKNNLS